MTKSGIKVIPVRQSEMAVTPMFINQAVWNFIKPIESKKIKKGKKKK